MTLSYQQFAEKLSSSGLMTLKELQAFESEGTLSSVETLASQLVGRYKLTEFQAEVILETRSDPLVVGDYFIMDRIGQGGMGIVYKSRRRDAHDLVALKMMTPKTVGSSIAVKRFRREIELASRLKHPNIVTAIDGGEFGGRGFLVMEFVDGLNLGAVLQNKKKLAVLSAFDHILDAAKGLAYAHRQGIVHRDIKPSNLLVNRDGTAKILDMGLARIIQDESMSDSAETLTQLTREGTLMGTADYIAPEQALNSKNADFRADIYSLGCTMHYAFTGRAVYAGETPMERLIAHREQDIPSLLEARDDLPPEVDGIFQKMIAKDPEDRYQSMQGVVDDMQNCRLTYGHMWMIKRFIAEQKLPKGIGTE
ncbi:MAG: serine/threonine protein kinase [Rubripirellula sp.]